MDLIERIGRPGPKKLLAIDGGGIRGVLALGPPSKRSRTSSRLKVAATSSGSLTISITSPAPAPALSSRPESRRHVGRRDRDFYKAPVCRCSTRPIAAPVSQQIRG